MNLCKISVIFALIISPRKSKQSAWGCICGKDITADPTFFFNRGIFWLCVCVTFGNVFSQGICPLHLDCQMYWSKTVYNILFYLFNVLGSVVTSPFSSLILLICVLSPDYPFLKKGFINFIKPSLKPIFGFNSLPPSYLYAFNPYFVFPFTSFEFDLPFFFLTSWNGSLKN